MKTIENTKLIKKETKFFDLIPYIFCFFTFSFLGWIMETLFCYGLLGQFVKRGFLYSPICPIYGTGALILMIYLDKSKSKTSYIKLFILFTIVFSFFEYMVGFALDALFATRWWDYSDSTYNLNGRITLLNSFFWGVITIIFTKFIYPLTQKFKEKVINKIPSTIQIIISCILISGITIDFTLSCIKYLR